MKPFPNSFSGALLSLSLLMVASSPGRAQGGLSPSQPLAPGLPITTVSPSGVYNQPVMVSSFEKVEMERLRLAEEAGKTERESIVFREKILMLQAEIAKESGTAMLPKSVPTEYRTFLSQNEGNIKQATQYYELLKSIVNDLTANSPYAGGTAQEGTNPNRAMATLTRLDNYEEDDGIARTLRAQVAALFQSVVNENVRRGQIDGELNRLAADRKTLNWNYQIANTGTTFNPTKRATDAETAAFQEKLKTLEEREVALKAEKNATLTFVGTEAKRKLQFQQYLVELAFQRRYIHALIACGFYRSSPAKGDMKLEQEAYPSGRNKGEAPKAPNNNPFGAPTPDSVTPKLEIPFIATISGMEAFLTTIIRDTRKKRDSLDNMLKEGQTSDAEAVLREMVVTAKYQPELNTLPYVSRQRILRSGGDLRELSNALGAKNYPEITRLVARIKESGNDSGMQNIKAFAIEQPGKALYLAKQAELAVKAGDHKSAQSLMDAAKERAPLDPAVNAKIDEIQGSALNNSKDVEEVRRIVDSGDYQKAFAKAPEYAAKIAMDPDKTLKDRFEALIEKEKALRAALEKCDVFERRSSYPDVWITLCGVESSLSEDARLVKRKSGVSGKCPRFIAAYTKANENEKTGGEPLALAWYLSALTEAPGNTELMEKVTNLGNRVLNH